MHPAGDASTATAAAQHSLRDQVVRKFPCLTKTSAKPM
jgi:hypothetical protein